MGGKEVKEVSTCRHTFEGKLCVFVRLGALCLVSQQIRYLVPRGLVCI